MAARSKLARLKRAYYNQKSNAKVRGIEFLISFDDWLEIWIDSGKLELRGSGIGKYCMCRIGDLGPYSKWNVFIGLFEVNSKDPFRNGREFSPETRKKISEALRGRSLSTIHKEKLSKARIGLKLGQEHKQVFVKAALRRQRDKNGRFIS